MADFKPSKKTVKDFNNGVPYKDYDPTTGQNGDVVQAEALNNIIESQLWVQKLAENPIDNSEANAEGDAEITLGYKEDGTPYLKTKSIKGKPGERGEPGLPGKDAENGLFEIPYDLTKTLSYDAIDFLIQHAQEIKEKVAYFTTETATILITSFDGYRYEEWARDGGTLTYTWYDTVTKKTYQRHITFNNEIGLESEVTELYSGLFVIPYNLNKLPQIDEAADFIINNIEEIQKGAVIYLDDNGSRRLVINVIFNISNKIVLRALCNFTTGAIENFEFVVDKATRKISWGDSISIGISAIKDQLLTGATEKGDDGTTYYFLKGTGISPDDVATKEWVEKNTSGGETLHKYWICISPGEIEGESPWDDGTSTLIEGAYYGSFVWNKEIPFDDRTNSIKVSDLLAYLGNGFVEVLGGDGISWDEELDQQVTERTFVLVTRRVDGTNELRLALAGAGGVDGYTRYYDLTDTNATINIAKYW